MNAVNCTLDTLDAGLNAHAVPVSCKADVDNAKKIVEAAKQGVTAAKTANTDTTAAANNLNLANLKLQSLLLPSLALDLVSAGAGVAATSSTSLTLDTARGRAKASAKDADGFASGVQAAVAKKIAAASSRSDYVVPTARAAAADSVVRAAKLADKFSDAAAAETDETKAATDASSASLAADTAQAAFNLYLKGVPSIVESCFVSGVDDKGVQTYTFKGHLRGLFPLAGKGCDDGAVLAYYNVYKTATVAKQAQYLYNAAQSTNQVSADLLTTVFPGGVQVVLAGTATGGSSQPAGTAGGAAATPASSTDSVATAVAKLEQGGDFNLKLAYPLLQHNGDKLRYSAAFYPNVGFAVNGLSSQATITESTDYTGNVPIEVYGEFGSIPNIGTSAVFYADAQFGGELLGKSKLASSIGVPPTFYLGQYSAGISFNNSVRIGFQYFQGPKQVYTVPGSAGSTPVTGSMSGVHLVVSFTPTPSK